MATWSGWQNDLLNAAGLPGSADNHTWLADWNASADSNCRNNPVDISHHTTGSTNCKKLTNTRTSQNYTGHASGAAAFSQQLHSGNFPHLLAAMKDGTPYTVPSANDVIGDLVLWGSEKFAFELTQNYGPPHGTPPPTGKGLNTPHAHKGWADLRHSVNVKLPAKLRDSQKLGENSLRQLAQIRKVLR